MAIYYFDTSAVVKRYVDEPGSLWVRQLCDQRDPVTIDRLHLITVGEITIVEASAALAILVRRNLIPKRFAQQAYLKFVDDFQDDYKQMRITSDSLMIAANLAQKYPLKAYDAVQLSLALGANLLLATNNLVLIFVSGDDQLLRAAQAEGLLTDNPFAHATQ